MLRIERRPWLKTTGWAMAKYLVLIYGNERTWADLPPEWHAANADRHQALIASEGPAILGVNELEPPSQAVSVRGNSSGRPSVTNGPFHETPEIVGGYYLIEARRSRPRRSGWPP